MEAHMFRGLRSSKLYIPLITILGSAALFFAYSFIYVSRQKSYANERAFRLLSVVGDQLTKHFENLQSVMAAALVHPNDDGAHRPTGHQAARYIKRVAGGGDQISVLAEHAPCPSGWNRGGAMQIYLLDNPANFSLRADFHSKGATPPCSVSAEVKPAVEFRERFHHLTADYFEDILIATSSGEVLFESNASGVRISNLDNLVSLQSMNGGSRPEGQDKDGKAKPNTFRDLSQFSNVRDVRFAGSMYKLYIQPVPLQIISEGKEKGKTDQLKTVICGLWRTDLQQSELVSLPYATLIWGVLAIFAVFGLLWPLLKVAYMSATERLKRAHVFYLLASSLFVTGILTVLVLNWAYMTRLDEEAHTQLNAVAERIDRNVRVETARALTLMRELECDRPEVRALLAQATKQNWTSTRILENPALQNVAQIYPYFDNIYWADRQGTQLFKLTVRGEATPQTPIGSHAYFKDVRDRQQQYLKKLKAMPDYAWDKRAKAAGKPNDAELYHPEALDTEFRLETRYSPNTGEYFVILAKATGAGLPGYLSGAVAQVLVTRFVSLQEPALPAGFGYAVLDHDGLVQFHSSERRNQIENFFKEARENPVLKSMVANRTQGYVNVDYSGREQLMRVWPLPYLSEPALTLIVFRDTNYFQAVNVACILMFGVLACIFSGPFLIGLMVYVFRCGSYPLARLWPNTDDRESYTRILTASACVTAAFVIAYAHMEVDESIIAVVAVCGATGFFAAAACRRLRHTQTIQTIVVTAAIVAIAGPGWPLLTAAVYLALSLPPVSRKLTDLIAAGRSIRVLYVATAFSLLTAIAVLPCFGLFRVAYHSVGRLATEAALQDRLDLLIHRAEAIRGHYSGLEAVGGESTGPMSASVEGVVTQRIAERLDRYDWPVFAPDGLQMINEPRKPHTSGLERQITRLAAWFPTGTFGRQLRETALAEDTKESPWSHGEIANHEVILMSGDFHESFPDQNFGGVYPMWNLPARAVAAMGVLAAVLIAWLSFMIRKLFLTDLAHVPALDSWTTTRAPDSNLLIIGHPKSGRSSQALQVQAKDWLDLAKMVSSGNWTPPHLNQPTVVVDNFEFDIENPETCVAKLKLLEDLLFVRNKRVILLSTVDPMFYAVASSPDSPAASQILDRWAAVLSGFLKLEMEDLTRKQMDIYADNQVRNGTVLPAAIVALVKQECDHTSHLRKLGEAMLDRYGSGPAPSTGELVEELLDRADAYYRLLWSTCTNQERLVLFQLARDGWANPKNARAIQQLERRRLVRRSPGLRIMNESFCRFIQTAHLPGEVAQWEEEVRNSTWSALKLGFTTAALAGGAWLLYTQQEIFQVGLGYVAAIGTASGTVITLVRNVSRAKPGGSPEKATNA
jgi:hypothetical protein